MRKLTVLLATAGFLLGFAGFAQASIFSETQSTLGLSIGALPTVTTVALPGTEGLVSVVDTVAGHGIVVGTATVPGTTVWSTVNFGPGTALFTGVPLISNLKVTVRNDQGNFQDGNFPGATNPIGGGQVYGPTFGGFMRLDGVAVVYSGCMGSDTSTCIIAVPVNLSIVGGNMGGTTMATLLGQNITATGGPFIAGNWTITGITSNFITIPERTNAAGVAFTLQPTSLENPRTPTTMGGFRSTATAATPIVTEINTIQITGTQNLLSASEAGTVTLISPMRINTNAISGTIPGKGEVSMVFVPEPGTMLLLVSGAVGLAVVGRRRMRK